MEIPDDVIETAAKAAFDQSVRMINGPLSWGEFGEDSGTKDRWRRNVQPILEAVAPFIAAQALKDAAGEALKSEQLLVSHRLIVGSYLRARAAELEAKP